MRNLLFCIFVALLVSACASNSSLPQGYSSAPRPLKNQTIHIVKKGDTLYAMARRYAISERQIQYRNGILDPRKLKVNSQIFIPSKNYKVPASFKPANRFIWPLTSARVSSEFGARHGQHKGTDLIAPQGTPIRAAAVGKVVFVGTQRGYGKTIVIQHPGNIQTLYAHAEKLLVKRHQKVAQGNVIATVGQSGNARGYHLHFEIIKQGVRLNPRTFIGGHLAL